MSIPPEIAPRSGKALNIVWGSQENPVSAVKVDYKDENVPVRAGEAEQGWHDGQTTWRGTRHLDSDWRFCRKASCVNRSR